MNSSPIPHGLSRQRPVFPLRQSLILAAFLSLVPGALAHRLSDACLHLTEDNKGAVEGRIDVALRDLAWILPMDEDGDRAVTWGELRRAELPLRELVRHHVRLRMASHDLPLQFEGLEVSDIAGDTCASLVFRTGSLGGAGALRLEYDLLFDVDPQHRGLLRFDHQGQTSTFVFSPDRRAVEFDLARPSGPAFGWIYFVTEGIHHIWIGTDHILFLLALLLPAVVLGPSQGTKVLEFRGVLAGVLKVVTAFTLAHSITLALATFRVVHLPSRWVETAIAASVAIAALNNLVPFFRDRGWCVAFGFGLIHGFGFASVLGDLDLPRAALARGLVGFNLGVELGQMTIVAIFLPVAYLLRDSWVYRRLSLQFGSACIMGTAVVWMAERAFGLQLPFL